MRDKKKAAHLKNSQLLFRISIILLIGNIIFLLFLFYFDRSPTSIIKTLLGTKRSTIEQFDNTTVQNTTKPISRLETIYTFLEILKNSKADTTINTDAAIDVTDALKNYSKLAIDFNNLSNLVTSWDNKYLAYNDSKLYLFQIAEGKIYLRTLEVPEIDQIKFAYIFKSGNILFCDNKSAYYSHDNLLSYQKSDVFDINGERYSANEYGNFFTLGIDGRQIIDGKEIRVWGNYTNYGIWKPGVSRSEQVQVWYTTDEGKTIKTAYKFGESYPKLLSRHVHSVNMCPWDNSFWVQTGDMENECHWLQGKYDMDKDLWTWKVKASGNEMSFYKSTGFIFKDDYVYWSDDSSDPEKHGIWKTSYTNLNSSKIDSDLFENVLKTDKEIAQLVGNNSNIMVASQYFRSSNNMYKIFISNDSGMNWETLNTAYQIVNIHPPNGFGHILGNYFINQFTFEAIHFWDKSPSIFINSYFDR